MTLAQPLPDPLVDRLRAGDRAAFSEVVREHQRPVFFHVLRMTRGDEALARDLTQKTFLRVWTHRDRFRGDASLRTWVLRIAHNLTLNELRRAWRHREVVPTHLEPEELAPAEVPGADQLLVEARDREALRDAVHDLSPRQKDVTLLRLYQDLSFPEIGDVLGITANNAKVHFHHAVRNLRRALTGSAP